MNIIKKEKVLCPLCFEEHEVSDVIVRDNQTYKEVNVTFDAIYHYCSIMDDYFEDEDLLVQNDEAMKKAYFMLNQQN